jgi:hypothetical protein
MGRLNFVARTTLSRRPLSALPTISSESPQESAVPRLSAENVELRSLVERLEARIAELEHRQGRNSGNSSLPPSRDDAEARAAQTAKRRTTPVPDRDQG